MTLLITSLLLAILGLVHPNQPNSILWIGKEMHILASLCGQRSEQSSSSRTSGLSELLSKPTERDPHETSQSQPVQMLFDFSDRIQIALSEANSSLLHNFLHQGPESISSSSTPDIRTTPAFTDFRTESQVAGKLSEIAVPSLLPPQSEDYLKVTLPRSPLDWILGPKGQGLSERVCARLIQAEAHEPNTSLRSDYRQAFICVSLASKGNTEPFLSSSYAVHGIAPEKVWTRVVNNRKSRLGREYFQFFDSNDMPRPDVKWDETVIYDLPSSAGVRSTNPDALTGREPSADSPSAVTARDHTAEAGRGSEPPIAPRPVPNIKERLA